MPLRIIIVGGGLAGLAAAIGFARHGHNVQVFERRSASSPDQSGSGILLQSNVEHILEKWGMLEQLQKVTHRSEKMDVIIRDEGMISELRLAGKRNAYYGLRRAIVDTFKEAAIRFGARVKENVKVIGVDVTRPAVQLQGGEVLECDLIVGADGAGSPVRSMLYPNFKPNVQDMACFQVVLPWSDVQSDPDLFQLTNGLHGRLTLAPGRSIFASPVPKADVFVIEFVDQEYRPDQAVQSGPLNGRISDNNLAWLRSQWSDHGPGYRRALQFADKAFRWRLVEVSGLLSWARGDGKVVLLGDASHSMTPCTGNAAGLNIEDAAVLTELLASVSKGDDLSASVAAYERLRRPRVERLQEMARVQSVLWSLKDEEQIQERNQAFRSAVTKRRKGGLAALQCMPDMDAPFHSLAFDRWLFEYDAFEEVRKWQGA